MYPELFDASEHGDLRRFMADPLRSLQVSRYIHCCMSAFDYWNAAGYDNDYPGTADWATMATYAEQPQG